MEWKPIKTARTDLVIGKTFVAFEYVNGKPYVTIGWFEYWEGDLGFVDETADEWIKEPDRWPTHWMPLPPPPTGHKDTDK